MARKSRKNPIDSTEKINFKSYRTAIYARLSRENQQGEKIETQIEEVRDYIKKRRIFELIDIYADMYPPKMIQFNLSPPGGEGVEKISPP